jgi:hypothetical protein
VQGHILSIGGRCSNKLDDEEANNTKTNRKCATVRPTLTEPSFYGGVPSLMEKIPNHLANEECATLNTLHLKPSMREQREAQWQAQR